jgi:iron complex transport system substrate-binding protein
VSAEQVSAFDADIAVMLPIGFTAAETTGDPLLASLPVVQDGRAIVLDPTDELTQAYSAASVLSIPVVLEQLVPKLAEAAAKVAK